MQTFLHWFIPIAAFLLLEIASWWFEKRLTRKIPYKPLRFLAVRLVTIIVLTFLIFTGLELFAPGAQINVPEIFILLCILYLILWFIVGLGAMF